MPILCILEDDQRRTEEMRRVCSTALPGWQFEPLPTAHKTVDFLRGETQNIGLISVDHELEPQSNLSPDPGTGRDVADFLAPQRPFAPVVIHSTNIPAAVGMASVLEERDWRIERITPYADLLWIEEFWLPTLRHLLNRK
jgi:hypothetical protein